MQNAVFMQKLKCQRYLSRVKLGPFLVKHSNLSQLVDHAASTYELHDEEDMFL